MSVLFKKWKVVKPQESILICREPNLRTGVGQVKEYYPEDLSIFTIDDE